ncbi:hypothetical protein Droror1_Dr00020318 [Drosera rotundifolia]
MMIMYTNLSLNFKAHKNKLNNKEVHEEISQLFKDHPDLIKEFPRFSGDNTSAVVGHHDRHGLADLQKIGDQSSRTPSSREMHIVEEDSKKHEKDGHGMWTGDQVDRDADHDLKNSIPS